MKVIKLVVAGACALGLCVSALADVGKAPWFAENASTVSTALSGGGKSDDGTWSNLNGQAQIEDGKVVFDADDDTAIGYQPDLVLTGSGASVTFTNVTFAAIRKTLPELETGTQAAVLLTTNESGHCVFAVAAGNAWHVTDVSADPEDAYTIRCDFTYGDTATVSYALVGESEETPLFGPAEYAASQKISTLKLMGSGSFAALGGDYPVATIDFGATLPEGVAKVTVNGNELVDGKATVAKGALATIEITAADGWLVDPTTISLPSVTANVDYSGENFPATVSSWAVVSADGSLTNAYEKLSAALAALEDGDTLMPSVAGEGNLAVKPTTFTKENLKAVPVDCPFVVTNNDVTVDFRGRVIKDAFAPEEAPEDADDRPYLVVVADCATNVLIRNGFLFGSGYDVTSSDPKDSDRRLVGVENASAEVENCVMFGPGVSRILLADQNASLVVRNSWFDGQGDGCQDVVLVSGGSELLFSNVRGFWNPEDFWGTEDGVNGSFTEITGEQFSIVDGSTLTLNCTVISNNFTQWIKPEELKTSAVVARGEGDNKLILDDSAGVWMGGGVPAVSAVGALEIGGGSGKVTGDVDGDGVVFKGGSYTTFNPESRVGEGYIATRDGDWWTVVPATRWMVVSEAGVGSTTTYARLSDALAALKDGDTLMPEAPGEGDLSVRPETFSTNDFRAVSVDCPFVITNNDVTVDFRGRVLRDVDADKAETVEDYLVSVVGATNVSVRNGFLFGTTWRKDYKYTPAIDHRGFAVSDDARVIVSNCNVFIAATSNSVSVTEGSRLRFVNCWIDGEGDGAEKVFHAADGSRLRLVDTKGFWDPDNFWGVDDGVVDTLPAITGEQFTLEDSYLYLDNTIISNTVTHWSEGGKVATPVTFFGEDNWLVLTNDASITATTGNVAVAKIALSEVGVKLYSDAEFAPNDEIVGGADGVKVQRYQPVGSSWKWTYMAVEAPSDPLPHPDEVPTDADVVKVMADAFPSLKAQIKTVNDYTNFYAWVESAGLNHQTAKNSKDAFFSFATDQDRLVDTTAVSNGAVKIVAMKTFAVGTAEAPTNMIGVAVKIKDIDVGEGAKSEFLKRVFGAEGAYDLNDKFSWQNVAFVADEKGDVMTPQEGCVLFFVVPYAYTSPVIQAYEQEAPAAPSADKFFLKATVDPCNAETAMPQDYEKTQFTAVCLVFVNALYSAW